MHPKRLESRILRGMNEANRDHRLVEAGDRILVAMSGGKDSYALLWGLRHMQAAAPIDFDLVPYHLDQGQPGHDVEPLRAHLQSIGLPFEIEYQDTYTRVVEKTEPGKVYCSLCSRFRRAILYKAATRHGCNKVALGHHRDDLIETFLLNAFFAGQIKAMPPRLLSENNMHEVIRPLCYVAEDALAELAEHHAYPILPCNLCGSLQTQRAFVKNLLGQLEGHTRHLKGNLLHALGNVVPSHLADPKLNPLLGQPTPTRTGSEGAAEGAPESASVVTSSSRVSRLPILNADLAR